MPYSCRKSGFSLVELSIVLVILGLLVGGVLGGQSLIRAAELRAFTTDAENIRTAIYGFRARYHGLPGDIVNATNFWGSKATCPAGEGYVPANGQETCNGNNDGRLGPSPIIYNVSAHRHEWFEFWRQLVNGGLFSGQFTGVANSASSGGGYLPGENCPRLRNHSSGCWGVLVITGSGDVGDTTSGSGSYGHYFPGQQGNALIAGIPGTRAPVRPILNAEDMWSIDTKFDDGTPDKGVLQAGMHNTTCYVSDAGGIRYDLSNQSTACSLVFRYGF